jgi:flagellar hook-associated protein 3 FlgL
VSQLTTEGPSAATISYYPAGNTTTPNTLNGNLTFTPGTDTIQVSSTTGFAVGQVFTVAGTTSNDGSYKVSSIAAGPPDTITVESVKVGATETVAATLSSESWYKGDNIAIEQRVRDSMLHPAGNSAPFGTEESSDLESVRSQLGVTQNLIKTKTEKHQSYIGFLDDRIISMENVDKNEAITLLLDDQRALEAGYQALSKVREMSLLNFLN